MFFNFFRKKEKSAKKAVDRLHIILAHERGATRLPFFEDLKSDIIKVLSKYVDTGGDKMNVGIKQQDGYDILEINVPVNNRRQSIN